MSYDSMINNIGSQTGKVNDLMENVGNSDDSQETIKQSMKLMKEQQKLTLMSEAFTKTMKATSDAAKSATTNMH